MPQKGSKGTDDNEEVDDENHSIRPVLVSSVVPTQIPHRGRPPSAAHSHSKGSDSTHSRPLGFGLRHAILVGRRVVPSTPAPSWKVSDSSILNPSLEHYLHNSRHRHHLQHGHQGQGLVMSARKLAASLWELQDSPISKAGPTIMQENVLQQVLNGHQDASLTEQQRMPDGQRVSPALSHISKGSRKRSPIQRKSGDRGRAHAKLENCRGHQVLPDHKREAQITTDGRQTSTPKSWVLSSKGILSNLSCGATTTSDLLKVLHHVWHLEEQHASNTSLVGTLRIELDEAQSQLQELVMNEKNFCKEVEIIRTRIAEERTLWQEQQEHYVMVAVQSVKQELENERKSKQKLEVLYKEAAKEFRVARKSLVRALEDLERERKARQLMEEVCDELAREIGQDKARVEELKLESVKVREEVEEERKMLQMAEIWREERVQMKLMEAKLELEEKNTSLDKLRSQLEAFLKTKRAGDTASNVTSDTKVDLGRHSTDIVIGSNLSDSFHSREHRGTQSGIYSVDSGCRQQVKQNSWPANSDDDDDLHSIELTREPLVRTASGNLRQQHCEREIMKRGLSDDSNSASDDCELLVRRSQGVEIPEKPRNDQQANASGREGAVAESSTQSSAQSSVAGNFRWIEHTVEGGENRELGQEQQDGDLQQGSRKSSVSWSSDVGNSESTHISLSPNIAVRSTKFCADSLFRTTSNSSHLKHEQYTKRGDWQHEPFLSSMVSSPTRKWNHHFTSQSRDVRLQLRQV